jgi:hypothetical protein
VPTARASSICLSWTGSTVVSSDRARIVKERFRRRLAMARNRSLDTAEMSARRLAVRSVCHASKAPMASTRTMPNAIVATTDFNNTFAERRLNIGEFLFGFINS